MAKLPTKSSKINPKELIKKKQEYVDVVQEELEAKGVNFFSPSGDSPTLNIDVDYLELPKNITEVHARDLGEYLNAYTQQKMYMRTLIGWTECMKDEARREYMRASDAKYSELSKTKLSETAKEREVNSDPEIAPYYDNYMDLSNKLKLLNLNVSSIEDAIFMISREVSRRSGDFNNEMRNDNVQRK